MTKQQKTKPVVNPMPTIDTRYDDLLEQTQALLQQARNHGMRVDEVVMRFNDIVSNLTGTDTATDE